MIIESQETFLFLQNVRESKETLPIILIIMKLKNVVISKIATKFVSRSGNFLRFLVGTLFPTTQPALLIHIPIKFLYNIRDVIGARNVRVAQ